MPRANRIYHADHVWHITHRCHQREFLLKFVRDRKRWCSWLCEAKKRYRLCVLNYIATRNHVHLLVWSRGQGEIARSMQLIAGRTAQEFNQRKGRRGAFWEDRYHATAVETDGHLVRCLIYIDLNMVRAGVVSRPEMWPECGYREIQAPRQRFRVIDHGRLCSLLGFRDNDQLASAYRAWVDEELRRGAGRRIPEWTESLAVGGERFLGQFKKVLGAKARHRVIRCDGELRSLK